MVFPLGSAFLSVTTCNWLPCGGSFRSTYFGRALCKRPRLRQVAVATEYTRRTCGAVLCLTSVFVLINFHGRSQFFIALHFVQSSFFVRSSYSHEFFTVVPSSPNQLSSSARICEPRATQGNKAREGTACHQCRRPLSSWAEKGGRSRCQKGSSHGSFKREQMEYQMGSLQTKTKSEV